MTELKKVLNICYDKLGNLNTLACQRDLTLEEKQKRAEIRENIKSIELYLTNN